MEAKTIKGTYGSGLTPCNVHVYGPWYAVEGSRNINCACNEDDLNDDHHRLNVEHVADCDTMTAGLVNDLEDLIRIIDGEVGELDEGYI